MNSISTDEDEPTPQLLVKDNNEEYIETCGDEIKDIVPRLQRLNVNDEEEEKRSEILNKPSVETTPSLMDIDEEIAIADSTMQVSPVFLNDMPSKISINDGTKAARGKENSLSTSNKIAHVTAANIQVGNQSQDLIRNMLAGLPTHIHPVNQNDEHKQCECEEMKETGGKISKHISVNTAPKNTKQVDPETGESSNTSGIILPNRRGNDNISKRDLLGQFDTIAGSCTPKRVCSADVSADGDQSNVNRVKLNISMPDTHNAGTKSTGLVESKRHRKIAVFANPASQMRQRRFSTFNRSSDNFEGETLSANSFSEDESKNSGLVEKDSPENSRWRCRKIKPSSTPRFQISPDYENENEKQPSPCKRKQIFTENLAETTGKLRKRYSSECNTEANSAVHSRSLSLGLKETYSSMKISVNRKSRKRTSSDSQNVDRLKSRRSSSSSDDPENK